MDNANNLDYLQIASGHFLTNYLPDNHEEMSDNELLKFAEEHAYCLVEYHSGEQIMQEIESLAHTLESTAYSAVTNKLNLLSTGQLHRKKTVTHGNPDREVGGLVTVDYVDITFKAEDWNNLTGG